MDKIRTYRITKGKHVRREFENGEPVTAQNRRDKRPQFLVSYSPSDRNEIRLFESQFRSGAYSHLGLVPILGTATVKTEGPAPKKAPEPDKTPEPAVATDPGAAPADAPSAPAERIEVPTGWRNLGIVEKRALVAKITGKPAGRVKATEAATIIEDYVNGAL